VTRSTVAIHLVFAVALVAATYPAWRYVVVGVSPTLDDLLQVRCGLF
jgi:hypothetical protein